MVAGSAAVTLDPNVDSIISKRHPAQTHNLGVGAIFGDNYLDPLHRTQLRCTPPARAGLLRADGITKRCSVRTLEPVRRDAVRAYCAVQDSIIVDR
jgi:hypothetical protein